MVTLQADIHFWTLREDIIVKDADTGAYKYQDKSNLTKERAYYEDKKWYCEARGILVQPKNSRPERFRDSLKEFEEILTKDRVINEEWITSNIYQIILSSGLIVSMMINTNTGDLTAISYDKYLIGKLLSEHIADVLVTNNYMIISYNECRLTIIQFGKPTPDNEGYSRLSSLDTKVSTFEADGPSGRRFQRRLCSNANGDMVVIWWHTSDNEIYPWCPVSRDRNRANILVYQYNNGNMELLCYCRTEMSPLSVMFSKVHPNTLLTVEQGFVKKGEVTVTSCVYKVEANSLQRVSFSTIPLEAPLTAHSHNPSEDCLLLACNNGVLSLHSDNRGMTHVTKAALIPTSISWMDSGAIVVVSNDRGQIQCFDAALSLVRLQTVTENSIPQKMFDLSEFFCHPPTLEKLLWAPSRNEGYNYNMPSLLMLHFSQGPLTCIKIDAGSGKDRGTSIFRLLVQYVRNRQIDEALNLLVSLNWNEDGVLALKCLTTILNHLFKMPLTAQCEGHMEASLGTFHVPVHPLNKSTRDKFGSAVRILTRRFFFKVLRGGRIEKAYRIALDLKDCDCFMYVYHMAIKKGDRELASAAMSSTRKLENEMGCDCNSVLSGDSCNSSCSSEYCSESCSSCFTDTDDETNKTDDGVSDAEQNEQSVIEKERKTKKSIRDPMSHVVSSPANLIQPQPSTSHTLQATMTSAITSEDGTVTINIRQSEVPIPPPPLSIRHSHSMDRMATDPHATNVMESARIAVQVDKNDLQNQYDRTFYQELSTEDEDGGTVKVVHFGVV